MKWILLSLAFVAVIPLTQWLQRNPDNAPKLWAVIGFLLVQHSPLHLYMAIDSWAGLWPGYTQGAEISLVDILLLGIYLTLPRDRSSVPFKIPFAFYFFVVLISVFQAVSARTALFYPWQLLREFFVYFVITKASTDSRVIRSLLVGLAFGLLLATCEAIWERFGTGTLRTAGGFSHENTLGMASHFLVYPFFALLLRGEKGWLPVIVSISGLLVAVLTTGRATVGIAVFGYIILFVLSAAQGWTPHKAKVAIASIVTIIVISPLFISSFADRFGSNFESAFTSEDESRVQMANAASMILSDHPMGVGVNQYVVVANQGYNQRAGLNWVNSGAFVHNAYWLTAAETGYIGIVAFVCALMAPFIVAIRCSWRNRGDRRADILLGLGVGLLTVILHSYFEWVLLSFQLQYLFAGSVGIIAGLAQQLGYWRHVKIQTIRFQRSGARRSATKALQNQR